MRLWRPRWWVLAGAAAASAPVALAAALNLFVAFALPAVLNLHPDRLRVDYALAWMLRPGVLEVRNLRLQSRSATDEWVLEAGRVRATIDLRALRQRRLVAWDVTADGVSFRHRILTAGPPDPRAAPIPPLPAGPPDTGERSGPWLIDLDGISVTGLRELWIQNYRYLGDATATADLSVRGRERLEVGGVVTLRGGDVTVGPDPMTSDVRGVIELDLVGGGGVSLLEALDAHAEVTADVEDLRFVDEYLGRAGWLSLRGGRGPFVADASVAGGAFLPGSRMRIDSDAFEARFFSYTAHGDGEVTAEVLERDGHPESQLEIVFRDYRLVRGDDPRPLVQGTGLEISARSPDVALDRPFARMDATLVIPESTVPDVTVFNRYLPTKLGLGLRGGKGQIRGKFQGSTEDSRGSGELVLGGVGVQATYDDLDLTGDFEVVGQVPHARLDDWHFDIAGSSVQLRNVTVAADRKGGDDSDAWWAALSIPSGTVSMNAPIYLDANVDVRFRDSVPFVTMFTERKPMPRWMRGLLAIEDVSGRTRIRLGEEVLHVEELELAGDRFEVRMNLRRHKALSRGILFVRYGQLSLGVRMHGKESDVHLFNARRWYDEQPEPTFQAAAASEGATAHH